jgi:hypothetical protein
MSVESLHFCEEKRFVKIILGVVCRVKSRGVVSLFLHKVDLQMERCCPSVHLGFPKERRMIP